MARLEDVLESARRILNRINTWHVNTSFNGSISGHHHFIKKIHLFFFFFFS